MLLHNAAEIQMQRLPLTEQLPMEVRTMAPTGCMIMEPVLLIQTHLTNSGGFTDEQLSNTDETRTIYRNSDGHPLVIHAGRKRKLG